MNMKWIVAISSLLFVAACSDSKSGDKAADKKEVAAADGIDPAVYKSPEFEKGSAIINRNACVGCHGIKEGIQGPSYEQIANKYTKDEKTYAMLTEKIQKGGTGVWGQAVMTANPTITKEDAAVLLDYIFLFKKP
jgi:cytochrome c